MVNPSFPLPEPTYAILKALFGKQFSPPVVAATSPFPKPGPLITKAQFEGIRSKGRLGAHKQGEV